MSHKQISTPNKQDAPNTTTLLQAMCCWLTVPDHAPLPPTLVRIYKSATMPSHHDMHTTTTIEYTSPSPTNTLPWAHGVLGVEDDYDEDACCATAVRLRVCGALGILLDAGGGVVQEALRVGLWGLIQGGQGVGVMGAALVLDAAVRAAQENGMLGGVGGDEGVLVCNGGGEGTTGYCSVFAFTLFVCFPHTIACVYNCLCVQWVCTPTFKCTYLVPIVYTCTHPSQDVHWRNLYSPLYKRWYP